MKRTLRYGCLILQEISINRFWVFFLERSGLLQKLTLRSINLLSHSIVSLLPRNQVVVVISEDVRDQSSFFLSQDLKKFLCLIPVPCPPGSFKVGLSVFSVETIPLCIAP